MQTFDVVVIGGGAAGLSAALMLGRAGRRTLVVDSGSPRNRFADHMHGVLGHDGLDPAELVARGRAEVAAYGVEVRTDAVERLDRGDEDVYLTLTTSGHVSARAVILATGLSDGLPDVPGLAEHWGTRVLHCPYCHGWEVRGRRLGVLMTSPLSAHQAELVRQWSEHVTVFSALAGGLDDDLARRLRARGVTLVDAPVVEVVADGDDLRVRTADDEHALDALFTAGALRPHDDLVAHLGLERATNPVGSFLAVDRTGRTSDERIWAVGNVVDPGASVPVVMGAGCLAGAGVNAALVVEDGWVALAAADTQHDEHAHDEHAHDEHAPSRGGHGSWPGVAPADFWEDRYASAGTVWSGRPNASLVGLVADLPPGRSLDLGCGEGADVLWLATHGWDATGVDISPTAIRRATEAAAAAGLDGRAPRFVVADLSQVADDETTYDLVTASFLHSPVALPRVEVLRRAAARVAPGGHLAVVTHAAAPPWADPEDARHHEFVDARTEAAALALDPAVWEVVVAENRVREATAPDGTAATLEDGVVLVRRRSASR